MHNFNIGELRCNVFSGKAAVALQGAFLGAE